ncbi:MAG TPA: hypothetical protein VGD00_03030 [Solirubrobacteraceae bacterium]
MHATEPAHRTVKLWLAAIVGSLALLLAAPALGQAAESNPNNYNCLGKLAAGTPEEGSEDQQVAYSFYCNGPITGYQLQSQVPVSGAPGSPVVSAFENGKAGAQLKETFSCGGEFPGYAVNCVGAAKNGYEQVAGQFAIEKKLCVEPRVDALLTVTYAYLEKGVITQAISGPFELGRPQGCRPDAFSGGTRLNPKAPVVSHKKSSKKHKKSTKKSAKKAAHKAVRHR